MQKDISKKPGSGSIDPTMNDESTQDRNGTVEQLYSSKSVEDPSVISKSSDGIHHDHKPMIVLTKIEDQDFTDQNLNIRSKQDLLPVLSNSEADLSSSPGGSSVFAKSMQEPNRTELGVINEEASMSQSASYHFSKSQNKDDTSTVSNDFSPTNGNKGNNFAYYMQQTAKSNKKVGDDNLLVPIKQGNNQNSKINRVKTTHAKDFDMIDFVTDLNHLSTSKNDLQKIDEELSKAHDKSSDDSEVSKNTKLSKNLKKVLKQNSKMSFVKPLDMTGKSKDDEYIDSNAKSLSSISAHSSINIDPDEQRSANDDEKKMKRTNTNMITVTTLSNYKFDRFPHKTSTKKINEFERLNLDPNTSSNKDQKKSANQSENIIKKEHLDSPEIHVSSERDPFSAVPLPPKPQKHSEVSPAKPLGSGKAPTSAVPYKVSPIAAMKKLSLKNAEHILSRKVNNS